ncbi:MAG: DUF2281 domain-containing protein [Leptolyngbyaceae cyanobacterium SM1_4_3]|nr:DUF2281 domain-containing protein [Leptolyngbyaceae cyanobacterium SM1_4_3]
MMFDSFDTVKLKEPISITDTSYSDENIAPQGTVGVIVEIFNNGEAYMVELFGGWVKADVSGGFASADRRDPESFMETIGVETIYPHQIHLVKPARETVGIRAQLLALMDELSEDKLEEVKNFAEFLKQKQRIAKTSS